jgi:hypothetical protein
MFDTLLIQNVRISTTKDKAMLKILGRTCIILLVAALVAGGIYLAVEHGGLALVGDTVQRPGEFSHGDASGDGFQQGNSVTQNRNRNNRTNQNNGDNQSNGYSSDNGGNQNNGFNSNNGCSRGQVRNNQAGFSLAGMAGVGIQLGKVMIITIIVLIIKAIVNLFKRQKPADITAS